MRIQSLNKDNDPPIAASLVSCPCTLEHSYIVAASSSGHDSGRLNSLHVFLVATVRGRIVSVRPCLKAAVLADSYVAPVLPFCLQYASLKEESTVCLVQNALEN